MLDYQANPVDNRNQTPARMIIAVEGDKVVEKPFTPTTIALAPISELRPTTYNQAFAVVHKSDNTGIVVPPIKDPLIQSSTTVDRRTQVEDNSNVTFVQALPGIAVIALVLVSTACPAIGTLLTLLGIIL